MEKIQGSIFFKKYSVIVKIVLLIIVLFAHSCTSGSSHPESIAPIPAIALPKVSFANIMSIPLPPGFVRQPVLKNTFAYWLRRIPLKKDKEVYLYNGVLKKNQTAQFAVLDVSIGDKDLQQCADAIMRLRAEYLYEQQQFNTIRFFDNEGGDYHFKAPYTRQHLDSYLQKVFAMCGSASLSKQLKSKKMMDMQLGDVLIKGGFPGHAVIVADMAINKEGKKIYLMAQSYMPAQDIHILNNPGSTSLSPWYLLNQEKDIDTPEFYFTSDQIKTW